VTALEEATELQRLRAKVGFLERTNADLHEKLVMSRAGQASVKKRRMNRMIDQLIAERLSEALNGLLKLDPIAITRLTQLRVKAGKHVEEHEAVQLRSADHRVAPELGLLGVLNAVAGKGLTGGPAIVALLGPEGVITCFKPAAKLTAQEKLGVGVQTKVLFS
jgi:hypothetical protein